MRQRLLVPVVGALFGVAVIFAFTLDAVTSRRERLVTVERETHNMAALLADQVRQLFANADQTLRIAALAYDDWLVDPRRSAENGYRMLKSMQGTSDILAWLSWFDVRGDLAATSRSPSPTKINIRDRAHFHVHVDRADLGMFMGAPLHAATLGEVISVVSRRIDGPHGDFAGVISAILNISYLESILKRYHSLSGVHVTLYLRDGAYIAHYPNPKARIGRINAHTRLFREELPKAEMGTYYALAEVSNEHRIFSYRTVAGHPFVVQVSMSRATALSPWYARIRVTGTVTALALLGAFLATWFISRQSARIGRQERIAQEARLLAEHSSRSKSEFLAHMSHELRTPMNAVIGFTEMIRREVFGPVGSPKYQEYLRDISVSGQHLLHVVNNILDLAKVEAGKWEMEETVCDVGELCDSTIQMVRERARSAEVGLSVAPKAPVLAIRADLRLMRQILINLLTNGIKFTERGGRVTLWWALGEDGDLALNVTDTGVGMTEDDRRRVLEPFGRGSAELARARHDTGLGLSICRTFAEMHGGRMEIESAPAKGTTVTVTIPRARVLQNKMTQVAAA
jgi:signal transduction histidine kinase